MLNSNVLFNTGGAGGYDLFSAMLQEAGHAFGMGNSDDPASPMYEQYSGARQGLTSGDISNVQAMYGTRSADTFEHSSGNQTLGTAATVASVSSHRAGAWAFSADLSSPADADAYRFVMPRDVTAGRTTSVQLATTGVSLANARLRVSDDRQQQIGEATDSHFAAALTVAIPNSQPGKTYFFSVAGVDSSAFAVGAYRVKLVFDPAGPEATVTGDNVPARQGSNNLLGSALSLVTPAGYDSHSYYRVNGRLDLPLLADWYNFQSAPVNGQAQSVAVVTVRTLEAGGRPPVIAVTDSQGRTLNAELVSSTADAASYQFFAPADQTLYLKVATNGLLDLGSLGAYQVEVSFRNVRIDFQDLAQSTLNPNATTSRNFTLAQPALTKFSLAADSAGLGGLLGQMSVRLVLKDAAGHEVARLTVPAGQTQTLSVCLETGTYTASVTAFKSSGLLSAPVNFTLKYLTLTDPVGSQPTDSTGTPLPYPGTRPPSTVPSNGSGGNQSTGNPPPPAMTPPPANPPPPPPPAMTPPPANPPPPPPPAMTPPPGP